MCLVKMRQYITSAVFLSVTLTFLIGASRSIFAERSAAPTQAEDASGFARPGITTRVSVASDGSQANDWSQVPSISGDGLYVAFQSWASNLVPGDTNNRGDIFVHNRTTGEITRVSVASDGTQADDQSWEPVISENARYVAFISDAENLVPSGNKLGVIVPPGIEDIFVHDLETGQTTLVSVNSTGDAATNSSIDPSISRDGHYVAFASWAPNLVPGDTNLELDVFVHDRVTGDTTRVSVASDGTEANRGSVCPSISADGRYVAFNSSASNLVAGDINDSSDVFIHDRSTGVTTLVSVASNGIQGDQLNDCPSLSADGRYVAFDSRATNLVSGDTNDSADIFIHDRSTGETTRVSVATGGTEGNSRSYNQSISADGRYVAFVSHASNLVFGDTNVCDWGLDSGKCPDIFVHDRLTGETTRASVASDGTEGNDGSFSPAISADGQIVAFGSQANNLVLGDSNVCDIGGKSIQCRDIFVREFIELPLKVYLPIIWQSSEVDH